MGDIPIKSVSNQPDAQALGCIVSRKTKAIQLIQPRHARCGGTAFFHGTFMAIQAILQAIRYGSKSGYQKAWMILMILMDRDSS